MQSSKDEATFPSTRTAPEWARVSLGGSILNRDKAYSALAQELERFRRRPREDLIQCVGGPTIEKTEWEGAELLTIEIRIEWADVKSGAIRIRATANGPSCWRLERLEETVVVHPPAADQ
jgi:hypothetical protein